MNIDGWAEALSEIVDAAKIKNAHLAREAKLDPAGTYRYLRRQRTPARDVVTRVNAAVGRLTGNDEVRAYLEAAWDFEHLEDDTTASTAEARFHMLAVAITGLERYIYEIEAEAVLAKIWDLPFEKRRSLLRMQDYACRSRLVRHFRGHIPDHPIALETIGILKHHGIDLTPYLRPMRDRASAALDDHFVLVVARALASTGADIATRSACEKDIVAMYFQIRYAHETDKVGDSFAMADPLYDGLFGFDGRAQK